MSNNLKTNKMKALLEIIKNIDSANIHTPEIIFLVVVLVLIAASCRLFPDVNKAKQSNHKSHEK
jgi:hypothetical protein